MILLVHSTRGRSTCSSLKVPADVLVGVLLVTLRFIRGRRYPNPLAKLNSIFGLRQLSRLK